MNVFFDFQTAFVYYLVLNKEPSFDIILIVFSIIHW